MEIIHGIENIRRTFRKPVITIGNFDGVHLGHMSLFQHVREIARTSGSESMVITFDPHPIKVLSTTNGPPLITLLEQKVQLIEEAGIDVLLVVHFTLEFAQMEATEFIERFIHNKIGASAIVVGPDYRFGRNRQGDIPLLVAMGEKLNFQVHVAPDFFIEGQEVSSSAIRKFVTAGDLHKARQMLGRDYQVCGMVIKGRDRGGRLLGFPTANLLLIDELTPKPGVYATQVVVRGKTYAGATNVGYNPTFQDGSFSVETHILDFNENIYGETIQIRFVERLRDEKAFSGPEELAEQIQRDVQQARQILAQRRAE
ncbi:MAG: bifunctional riboflavin kinase/FAD synthetase [Deltaproteobacteria bacterium]|nr:bifunctional riboflavin kinase/FAD synthetase [Deltaproteobacteria bacterium]MBW2072429.1 bifunctional riboflavin kinase/FAD synthetase [Deltaproteobacteria bacterium]